MITLTAETDRDYHYIVTELDGTYVASGTITKNSPGTVSTKDGRVVDTFYSEEAYEAELTRLLTEEMNRGIANATLQDLMTVHPMDAPQGNLFYFDYNYGPMEEPIVYDDGSWSMDNIFEGVIGIKSEIKQHTLI